MKTMAIGRTARILAALLAVVLCAPLLVDFGSAPAATENPTTASPGYHVMVLNFDSQLTASVANKATFTMPWASRLVQIKCSARLLGGTGGPTYTWTLQEGAGTVATCAPTAAATEVEGTISDAAVADEATVTLDYASTGTSPTADDAFVMLIWKRQ